jgi:protein TonB
MIFIVVCALVLIAIGIVLRVHASAHSSADSGATSTSSGASPAASASVDASGTGILLGLAKTAMSEHRLLAPAGSNAYEFYLSVLQLDPRNATAQDNLRASFDDACNLVEHAIDTRDLDEAQREISLLRDYDTTNYKLALLGSKLSAQRSVMTREHEAQAAIIQSAAADAQTVTNGGAH